MKIPFIEFPGELNFRTLSNLQIGLASYSQYEAIGIDFRAARWATPFFLTAAAICIVEHKSQSRQRIKCINVEHCSYFSHMGFFRSFGLEFGRAPGEARGNENYLPIQIINSEEVRGEAIASDSAVGLVMEAKAEKLARILARAEQGSVVDTLTFSLREMFRNIVEHSKADRLAYCAQAYPTKRQVEVGVFDLGIGLRAGLEENRKIKLENDSDAIQCALMPGVSGKAEKVKKLRHKDEWTNSGYGLYMTSRLFRDHGRFSVGSGDSALILAGSDTLKAPWKMSGTAIQLVLHEERIGDLQALLDAYKSEGAKLRQRVGGSALSEPSVASTNLARNFRKADESS